MNDRPISLVLAPDEQRALRELIDAAVRHAGIGAVKVAGHFLAKLDEAASRADADARTDAD